MEEEEEEEEREDDEAAATERVAKGGGDDDVGGRGRAAAVAAGGNDIQSSNAACGLGCGSILKPLRTEKEEDVFATMPLPLQQGRSPIAAVSEVRSITSELIVFFQRMGEARPATLLFFARPSITEIGKGIRRRRGVRSKMDDQDLNEYELARARLIARNRERMAAMGLLGAANALSRPPLAEATPKATASTKRKREPRPPRPPPREPTRASKRLRVKAGGEAASAAGVKKEEGESEPESEAEEEEGEGEEAPPRWTEEQLRSLRRDQELKMSGRLRDLELSGLIDASPGIAHFAIVGAHHKGQKRKNYKVTLETAGGGGKGKAAKTSTSCECVDFKIRRKRYGGHCKHIKLVLAQLGLLKEGEQTTSDGWEEALQRVVMSEVK